MADPHTRATFQALVGAIIPVTPMLAAKLGSEQSTGAVNVHLYKYVIRELDHSYAIQDGSIAADFSFSKATARLLDTSAIELIRKGLAKHLPHAKSFPGGGPFSSLRRHDRLRTIDLLDQLDIELHTLPPPYQDNAALIQTMMNSLNQITLFGYYGGWSVYGTHLGANHGRKMSSFPQSWVQVGYPGPAFGYRDFRGYLLRFPHKGEKA